YVEFTATNQVLGQRNLPAITTNKFDVFKVLGGTYSGSNYLNIGRNNTENSGVNWDSPHFSVANNGQMAHRNPITGSSIGFVNPTPNLAAAGKLPLLIHTRFDEANLTRALNGSVFGTVISLGTSNNTALLLRGGQILGANNASGSGLGGDDSGFIGKFSEVFLYDRILDAAERAKVNTYLGIKYGVTLHEGLPVAGNHTGLFNYVDSQNTVVWDGTANTNYHNNVAGIARDDLSALHQKQSKSVNADQKLIIGAGTGLAETNAANVNSLNDGQFLIVGDNGLPQSFGTVINNPDVNIRFDAIWKVQNTNSVGQVTVAWPKTENLYLVRSVGNDTFDSSDDFYGMTDEATINGIDYNTVLVTLNDGDYFTFAGFAYAPGGVTGPDFWVRSDMAGDIATAWQDHSTNADDIPNVGGVTLSPADRAHNFHPYTTDYSSSKYFYNDNSAINPLGNVELPNTNTSIFSAVRPITNGTGRIIGIDD